MDLNHQITESESVALPFGEAPIILAGTKGFEPLQNDLESFVLAITPSSLKMAGASGFEPENYGIKTHCLTIWLCS